MSRDITLADTIYILFTTRAFATGIPTTLAGTPVVSAYENEGLTQITAGITLGVDHDGMTGLHLLTIVATGANGYETAKDYALVITTGTVGGVSVVGEVVGEFTIGRSAAAVDLANGSDGLGAIKGDTAAILLDTADMQPLIEKMAYVGPRGLGVWIDDGAANTNTVLGTDGTPDNPVSTIAAATTIATALGSQRFYLMNDTEITLAQTYEGYEFIGIGNMNKVTLGSQDVDHSIFFYLILTGTQGGTQFMRAIGCQLQALLSAEILADECWLTGDITLRAATNHSFGNCKSGMPGNATPDLTFPGAGTTSVNFRHYSGGLTVKSATVNDTMSFESDGQLIIDVTCTSLEITIRGNCTVTDNGTTSVITQSAAINAQNIEDAVWDAILTGATHNIATSAGRRLRGIQEFQGYELGAIWIDTVNGVAGTTDFENGTVENPVDSIADANTLAASLGISRFVVNSGSSITFAASQENQSFLGNNWTLALGGQSISGTRINGAIVSGIGTGATEPVFEKCDIGNVTLVGAHFENCGFTGTLTVSAAADYLLDDCHSNVPGNGNSIIDFGAAVANTSVHLTNWNGGLDIRNMGQLGTDKLHITGMGDLILNVNCIGGTLDIHGDWDITDNSATVTITQTSVFNAGNVNAEVDTALADYDGPTMAEMDTAHALLATPAQVATELGTYDGPTKAEMDTAHALLATPTQVNTEVDNALNTAIPGSPTADSINQRVKAVDDLTQASGGGDLAAVKAKTDLLPSGVPKNAALSNFPFLMVDDTDHITPKTGLTVTAQVSKDGAAFANAANAVAEISAGVYKIDMAQAEMNVDVAVWKFTATGADQRTITIVTST